MNTKCNCCIKEDVCNFKETYIKNVEDIKKVAHAKLTISIRCPYFSTRENYRKI